MSFYGNNQQAQLMAQMFQSPQGGGMPAPQPGQGGVGAGMNLGPSFGGPDGAPGVQNMPFSGPMPDFNMGAFQPGQPTGIQDLGSSQGMQAPGIEQLPYQEPDGFGQGFSRGFGQPEIPKPGMKPPVENMPQTREKDPRGMAPGFNPGVGQKAGGGVPGAPGFNPVGPGAVTDEDERKRQVLIQAIMKRAFGG